MTNEQKNDLLLKFRKDLEASVKRFKSLKLMTAVTTDGGDTLNIDGDISLGVSVYSIDENGNNTPTEDGEYALDNGMVITVTDGKISNIAGDPQSQDDISSPDEEMDNQELADTATAPTDAAAPADTDNSDLANDVAQLKEQMAQVIPALQQLLEQSNNNQSMTEQVMQKVEAISKEPAAPGIKNKPVSYSANKQNAGDMAKLNLFAKAFNKESF